MQRFSKPPYGTILQFEGGKDKSDVSTLMHVSHPNAYILAAAPVVATILQILDCSVRSPGTHLQAIIINVDRFFADWERFNIEIEYFM